MKQKIQSRLLNLATLLMLVVPAFGIAGNQPALAACDPTVPGSNCIQTGNATKCGSNDVLGNGNPQSTSGTNCDTTKDKVNLNQRIADIINIFSAVVGIVAVIMIIVGGFRYVSSGGKQESVTSAKNTILYAVVGLVIVALAQAIVHFVLNKTT